MNNQKSIVLVIPIYNRIEVTKQGLAHIINAVNYYKESSANLYGVDIIVVDDGSSDGSKEWISLHYPQIHIVVGSGNLWWTGAVNMGIQYALDNYSDLKGIILQNDDIVIEPNWIFNYIQAIDANPQALIGCATSVLDSKNMILYGGRLMHHWFAKEKKINQGTNRSILGVNYTVSSFDLYGRGLYIPYAVFRDLGLFNNKRFKHRGDMDLPLRAKKAGYKLLVSYDAIVYELPQHAYDLDGKQRLTFKEAYTLLTDFRSSYAIKHLYYYSVIATKDAFHFVPFFIGNFYFHLRTISWRVFKNYLLKSN
ncbi:putative glycosyltransferase [Arcticibacter svalbardensis MN12-7]|uniref:Putative glycosyltransferase n=1 Tax=Arcticibacter svalbardensis MN12-7 TaxID=1150600 RepID=R9GTK7_9SPHI|nr:glycosyltransferase family 2 protein [Arcticibacter svalbardensis]EOR95051.1 putative glycosyltransferase [Arcticibacter svalbardensis MN12-7]